MPKIKDRERIEKLLANRTLEMVKTSDLIPNPNNPRENFIGPHMDQLRDSIGRMNILNPLYVTKLPNTDDLMIIDGERRWRCAKDLNIQMVPAIVLEEEPSDDDKFTIMLHLHSNREDWDSWERVEVISHMLESYKDMGIGRIAKSLGMKPREVKLAKIVSGYPEDFRKAVQMSGYDADFVFEMNNNLSKLLDFPRINEEYDLVKICWIF